MLLLDGDVLVYRFAHSEQVVTRWHRDLYTQHALLEPAKLHVLDFINEIQSACVTEDFLIVLSDNDGNFRKELPRVAYKQHRMAGIRPILWKPLRDWMLGELGARWAPRLEGDDMLGLLARPGDTIATIDKDLATVPGLHFNWDHPERGVRRATEEQAMRFFLEQTLTGDQTDGYKGVPGIGPVKAKRLLDDHEDDPWGAIVEAYEKAGLSAEVALENARCAWILRGDDFNFETNEVRLWTPDRLEA